jgi:DNA processing protein
LKAHFDHPSAFHPGLTEEQASASLEWLKSPENHFIPFEDPRYPALLKELPDPPPFLFVKGRIELMGRPAVAIVGSRNASRQGCVDAEAFARTLSCAGLTIVSGLAEGIDSAAHRGALKGTGSTIAVIATGADRVYPPANRPLAQEIVAHGLIISEFPLGLGAQKWHFPKRNRLIAGLSLGCLVVEASLSSGSIITARLALEQGREVFAIPGSIHSPFSKGCHRLIREGAKLVETANDILEELRYQVVNPVETAILPSKSGDPVLDSLTQGPLSVDQIIEQTGLTAGQVSLMLTSHELEGRVAVIPGGRYQRIVSGQG